MKSLLLLASILMVVNGFSTIRTVSNQPSGGAQFNTIQAGIDASADGDTLYIHGSATTYASFTLTDKKLALIGPGWAPDKNIPLPAIIAGCSIRNSPAAGSPGGTELQGLMFSQHASLTDNLSTDLPFGNLRIIRCQFNSTVAFSLGTANNLFEGCIFITTLSFTTNSSNGVSNMLFQNNVFFAHACCSFFSITGLNTNISNVHFDHNLFYSNGLLPAFNNSSFLTLSNNIFIKRNLDNSPTNSTFTNNITHLNGAIGDTVWIRNGNTGTGNIAAQNPQMVDQAAVEAGNFSALLNYTIPSGPAKNTGSDGKDIGLLFDATGSLNWANSRNSRFPRIFSMNITTPTVAPGGNISVTVEAKKSN